MALIDIFTTAYSMLEKNLLLQEKLNTQERLFAVCWSVAATILVVLYIYFYHKKKSFERKEQGLNEIVFRDSEIYRVFQRNTTGSTVHITDNNWNDLLNQTDCTYNFFTKRLQQLHPMSVTEVRVCVLIKLGFSPYEIGNIMNYSKQAVSSIRKRLSLKCFGKDASPASWDEFIRNF